eukprot:CAMPEP_0197245890 /NCGR_PEP_ID=MMETSP1429-20130617/10534_1 /TAXON_ID=49237 /ORGANISM="Chaetoceros  sp., Strain UNC1202" /LENGTH=166 /DNA_ID=CAMNT_0042706465 /DNA_START=32 /DNA_END=532 /DNA_ORIENTATION=+
MIFQLVHFLWIPRLGPDSIEYVDPLLNTVSRVSAMKLLGGYDISVDYEVRDRSTEILLKLTDMSDDIKKRVGRKIILKATDKIEVDVAMATNQPNTRFYDAIIPALTTKVGRDQTPQLAARLLSSLAKVDENRKGIMYAERRILRAANVADAPISDILFNNVLKHV